MGDGWMRQMRLPMKGGVKQQQVGGGDEVRGAPHSIQWARYSDVHTHATAGWKLR